MGGHASVEGDVYSYGILLLEMFTGVSPRDERFRDGLSLQTYVEMAFHNKVMDIVDAKLLSELEAEASAYTTDNVHSCLASVIQCGLHCSKELSKERIAIKDVANELQTARAKLLMVGGH
jgi:serine/threonine protein kinase